MKKVSVIMPTYNNEDCIRRSIESVINQTMHTQDYELIIVDDCSTDNTLDIIENYARQYNDFIRVKQLNVNSGSASIPRNTGLELSNGEYVFFLDSDDYIHKKTLKDLYNYGVKHDSDLIIGKYGVEGKGRGVPKAIFEKGNVPKAEIIQNSIFYALSVLKMFRKSVIQEHNIKFKADAKTAEDQLFTVKFLMNSRNYAIKTDVEYYVVVNNFEHRTHLTSSHSTGSEYFATIKEIYKAIYNSTIYTDADTRDEFAGKFTTRLLRHGRNKNFALSQMCYEDKIEWLKHYSVTLNELPRSMDKYVTQSFNIKLEAIRQNNIIGVMLADKLL
ncbi:glycosyltransferase family 2 protein [Staphylococcus durrellii]|uniref:glycosyltransferase family 2 protein n=1 Tax=Staphylococcus durrellii TaxID=2781773 RepID=UPI00189DF301|nr:glycosyltransferase family 2 protein [Staphylococcus durrellii]MBF7017325.1 glycosyltransferase family 2 protein [Staphylococcus durrellii]